MPQVIDYLVKTMPIMRHSQEGKIHNYKNVFYLI